METKKKEKKYFLGIIGGLILGLLFCALIVSLYIYTDFIALLGMLVFLGIFEYWGYKLLRGKIDKKLPWIIAILSSINVIIMAFLFIPTALLVKSNIQIGFKEIGGLYSQSSISLNILQDFLLSLVCALFGSYALGTVVKRKVMLRVNKIKLFSSDNKEKQELKEEAINVVKDIFKRLNAVEKEKAVKKEELLEQIDNENAKMYISYLYSLRIIKKYKGKYYYCEEAESNIKLHREYWKGAITVAITIILIVGILLSFGLVSQSKKKVYNNDVSFTIDNSWNEYKVNEASTDEEDGITSEQTWMYYKYMNPAVENEEHSYPEIITVSYGDNSFGEEMKINDLRNLLEGYFYEYMKFSNYQVEVLTTDNGYDALEMLIGYEDSMEFCYYLLNGDKIAFISASTASDDENLYDSLEEYTKEVVNSFKWNK